MAEFQRIEELGFADFIAMLLVETLDSIVAAHASQEERLRALEDAALQDPAEFAATAITDDMIELGLQEFFPDGRGGTVIAAGGPVPDEATLGVPNIDLGPKDIEDSKLTDAGVRTIKQGVRLRLAQQNLEALQEVARQGVPRVRVDGGVLRSKLTFSAIQRGATDSGGQRGTAKSADGPEPLVLPMRIREDFSTPRIPPGSVTGAIPPPHLPTELKPTELKPTELDQPQHQPPLTSFPGIGPIQGLPEGAITWPRLPSLYNSILDSIQKTRLTVRPADPNPPSDGEPTHESSTTIYSEVEIHFHTEL